jgi:hypothetical protein
MTTKAELRAQVYRVIFDAQDLEAGRSGIYAAALERKYVMEMQKMHDMIDSLPLEDK